MSYLDEWKGWKEMSKEPDISKMSLEQVKDIIIWQYEQLCEKQDKILEKKRILNELYGCNEKIEDDLPRFEDGATWEQYSAYIKNYRTEEKGHRL